MFDNNYYITSIMYDKQSKINFIGLHNSNVNRDEKLEDKDYAVLFDGITNRDYFMNILRNGLYDLAVSLDYRFIKDHEMIELLKEKNIRVIRIIGDNYSLSLDDYNKLKFAKQILVDYVDSTVHFKKGTVSLQKNIFRKEYRKGNNNQITYFVNRLLEPLEISLLVSNVKKSMNTYGDRADYCLSFRFHSKEDYYNILLMLKKYKLPNNIKLQFMGNPLEDTEDEFSKLYNIIDNDIEIIYNSSNNIINKYLAEPYTRYNYYHLEIEAEGICSLSKYIELLTEVNVISDYIHCRGYSPLESLVYGYRYLHKNYMSTAENNNFFDRRKKLNSEEFTNLFSLIMRKNNIKVYKYSTDDHVRNIVLVLDYKYNIFKIGVIDPYWDSVYRNNKGNCFNENAHTYFMISPKDTLRLTNAECITIGASLVLDEEIINQVGDSSRSGFETDINNEYSTMINTVYLLIKMGYEINNKKEYFKLLEQLNSKGYLDTLDTSILKTVIKYVEKREVFDINSYDIAKKLHSYEISLLLRQHAFIDLDTIKLIDSCGNSKLLELNENSKIFKK